VTNITFTLFVEHPPPRAASLQAYIQDGSAENYVGDYSFSAAPPRAFTDFTYTIDRKTPGLNLTQITSFRIKVKGPASSFELDCAGARCPVLHIRKVSMR
jgi:hypothetical protein